MNGILEEYVITGTDMNNAPVDKRQHMNASRWAGTFDVSCDDSVLQVRATGVHLGTVQELLESYRDTVQGDTSTPTYAPEAVLPPPVGTRVSYVQNPDGCLVIYEVS